MEKVKIDKSKIQPGQLFSLSYKILKLVREEKIKEIKAVLTKDEEKEI